jgi:putative endonuclease
VPHVYIVECSDGSYYTGSTFVLERRLAQHQRGEGANFTRKRTPVTLVWAEEFESVRDAFEMERRIHGWSRAKKRALIDGRLDLLPGLSRNRTKRTDPPALPHGP